MPDPSDESPVDPLDRAHALLRAAHGVQVGTAGRQLPPLSQLQAGRLAQELTAVLGWMRVYLRRARPGYSDNARRSYAHDRLEQARRKVETLAVQARIGAHPVVDPVAEAVGVLQQAWGTIAAADLARLAELVQAVAEIADTVAADGQQCRETTWQPAAALLKLAHEAVHVAGGQR